MRTDEQIDLDLSLSIAILAGGASRRMGTDKAMLSILPHGPPLLGQVINRIQSLSNDVFIVASDRPQYGVFGVPVLAEACPGQGPLGGIAAALTHSRYDACLVVACDMPFLDTRLLRWMAIRPRDHYDVLVPLVSDANDDPAKLVYQTLHAIYRRGCLAPVQRCLATGNRRISSFYPDVRVETITEAEVRRIDPLRRSFYSVNTPETLAAARRWLDDSVVASQ